MEVQYVKGIGPPGAKVLAKLGIASLEDLLLYLPRRYEDRSNFRTIASVRAGEFVTLKGRLVAVDSKAPRGNFTITRAGISDGSGTIGLVWFNQRWIRPRLSKITGEIIVYGQVKEGQWGYEINSPEWEPLAPEADGEEFARIVPVYPLVEGVPQKTSQRPLPVCVRLPQKKQSHQMTDHEKAAVGHQPLRRRTLSCSLGRHEFG